MSHTHLNHRHAGDHQHAIHHEGKREMENKTILWIIGIILVVAIVVGVVIFTSIDLPDVGLEGNKPQPVSDQCQFACETNQKSSFCDVGRKADNSVTATCNELVTNQQYSKYNVQACPSISCTLTAQELDKTCVTGLNSVWMTPTSEETCPSQENKFARKRIPSDDPPIEGQICCYYYG